VKASYGFWAPWIGMKTRKGDSVYNTEYRKCHKIPDTNQSLEQLISPNYSEEDLLDMMNFAQVRIHRLMPYNFYHVNRGKNRHKSQYSGSYIIMKFCVFKGASFAKTLSTTGGKRQLEVGKKRRHSLFKKEIKYT
jgi:hypothetical protein